MRQRLIFELLIVTELQESRSLDVDVASRALSYVPDFGYYGLDRKG